MRFLRFGICFLVAFGVLAHGAVEGWARAFLETGAGLLFLAWAVHACFHEEEKLMISPLVPPLTAFSLVALGQLALHRTASPFQTRLELQLLVACLVVLFVATQAFRRTDDWRGFVWFAMVLGFIVAVFGILQHLTFNGKLYWFREMRYGGIPFGPYANRNHFAGLMELLIPLALVPLVMGKVRRERWFLVGLFAMLPMGALFLSASRGGIISFAVELAALVFLMVLQRRAGKHALAGGIVVLVAVLLVSWLGVKQVLERFSSLQSLEVTAGKRASMRADTWRIFLDHPWAGTGLGTLQIVYPRYETLYDGKIVNHAHNDYLEALAETGLVGGLCCAWFLGVLFFASMRRLTESSRSLSAALHLSGLIGCTGLLVHSLVDFNLHIPANAMIFFLAANLATTEIVTPVLPSSRPDSSVVRMRKRQIDS